MQLRPLDVAPGTAPSTPRVLVVEDREPGCEFTVRLPAEVTS